MLLPISADGKVITIYGANPHDESYTTIRARIGFMDEVNFDKVVTSKSG